MNISNPEIEEKLNKYEKEINNLKVTKFYLKIKLQIQKINQNKKMKVMK